MKQISAGRKAAFYFGFALMILGVILLVSTFVTLFFRVTDDVGKSTSPGAFLRDPEGFQARIIFGVKSSMIRGFSGAALMIIGGIVRKIGALGFAGSGVVLAPQKAREDLEPFSRMAGGMVKDGLEEAKLMPGERPEKVVMVKCPRCGKLNDEDSKFCQECGQKM